MYNMAWSFLSELATGHVLRVNFQIDDKFELLHLDPLIEFPTVVKHQH